MDELVLLSEPEAERSSFETQNCRMLFRLLVPFVFLALLPAIALLTFPEGRRLIWVPLSALILIRGLYFLREHPIFTRHFRTIFLGFLIFQMISWRWLAEAWPGPERTILHPLDILIPSVLIFFRLRSAALWTVLGAFWFFVSGRHLAEVFFGSAQLVPEVVIAQTLFSAAIFFLVRTLTRRRQNAFREAWRREHRREQDRRRMQGELDDARRFQLAMLPRSEPAIPGLDVSGMSIPASEVGGDYYGYFPISDGTTPDRQWGLVVADVSGHGVASGLLLSGVRSCLHLLQESALSPLEVLERLDRMLRRIAQKRAFVTMVYGLWDDEKSSLAIASAGHPPVLWYRAARDEVEEIDLSALPLGTPIPGEFRQTDIDFEPSDVFLLYTDGIAETMNAGGKLFGDERLRQALGKAAKDPERSAKAIRDALLSTLWSFKADGVQHDDVTLVVGRVRAAE